MREPNLSSVESFLILLKACASRPWFRNKYFSVVFQLGLAQLRLIWLTIRGIRAFQSSRKRSRTDINSNRSRITFWTGYVSCDSAAVCRVALSICRRPFTWIRRHLTHKLTQNAVINTAWSDQFNTHYTIIVKKKINKFETYRNLETLYWLIAKMNLAISMTLWMEIWKCSRKKIRSKYK